MNFSSMFFLSTQPHQRVSLLNSLSYSVFESIDNSFETNLKEYKVGVQKSLFLSYLDDEDILLRSVIYIDGAIRGLLLERVDRKASH